MTRIVVVTIEAPNRELRAPVMAARNGAQEVGGAGATPRQYRI
jgi:hypothetical protein